MSVRSMVECEVARVTGVDQSVVSVAFQDEVGIGVYAAARLESRGWRCEATPDGIAVCDAAGDVVHVARGVDGLCECVEVLAPRPVL